MLDTHTNAKEYKDFLGHDYDNFFTFTHSLETPLIGKSLCTSL